MTTEQMLENSGIPPDLLTRLISAGYSGHWKSNSDFAEEAAHRCLSEKPF
jgi:hypothetical protein